MTAKKQAKEQQYSGNFDFDKTELGWMTNQVWHEDPKRVVFVLSRYKFVAKMLAGKARVAEVGCGDAFGSRVVASEVGALTVTDFDPLFIESIENSPNKRWHEQALVHDITRGPLAVEQGPFDALYCLDVFEHIEPEKEHRIVENLKQSTHDDGVVIIGIPSLESQQYASEQSKIGHINCKSGNDFKALLQQHFRHVFLFSMNDEVVHTGFYPMAHYLFAVCAK
ncbi:class I SAM-dependent methyltransferase [Alteromonas sp. a30]|uniref:class I SAM-dependent methyltransferase n=1 Tax=Alteromonas sp. a30 TaxID=2730917 RepID=UPI002282375B|nr:class I SAM-dependent methyltransferase [Alteromonas sp. a30]MCY7294461.1 class I SAM-dependent methyltransferase [Alteromonas sp. a30]